MITGVSSSAGNSKYDEISFVQYAAEVFYIYFSFYNREH